MIGDSSLESDPTKNIERNCVSPEIKLRKPQLATSNNYHLIVNFQLPSSSESEEDLTQLSRISNFTQTPDSNTYYIERDSVSPEIIIQKSQLTCTSPIEYAQLPSRISDGLSQKIDEESPTKTGSQAQLIEIEQFQSQLASAAINIEIKTGSQIIPQANRRKRRITKTKKGLCHQLENILQMQQSRFQIFKHEQLIKNLRDDKEPIEFRLKNKWKHYGLQLLEVELLNSAKNIPGLINQGDTPSTLVENGKNYKMYSTSIEEIIYKGTIYMYYTNVLIIDKRD